MSDREHKRRKLTREAAPISSSTPLSGHPLHHHQHVRSRPPLNNAATFPSPSMPHGHLRETGRSPKGNSKPLPPIFSPGGRSSHTSSGSNNDESSSHETKSAGDTKPTMPMRPRLPSHGSQESIPSIVEPGDEVKVEGYRDVRVISVHYDDVVACRAHSIARGDQRVALKFSLSAKPSAAQQFKAETVLLNKLREAGIQNITKVLARESGRYGTMLVVALEEVKTWTELFKLRERGPPPFWSNAHELVRAIDWAIRLVNLVASIHKQTFVHNSIRPSTVSTSMFSEVYLHDFSCAFSTGGSEGASAPIRERGMKEESLPYLAPECSGRVGKTADYRSDFYSIGATLFEIFAGQTPFPQSHDPLEIIHSHITKRPPLVDTIDRSVPHGLALIIAKLLEKSPDARYQTAQGLAFDLEQVKESILIGTPGSPSSWSFSSVASPHALGPPANPGQFPFDSTSSAPPTPQNEFSIGAVDESANFKLPPSSRLFGREDSVKILRESFERVKKSNKPAVVIIKGHSGIGKTSLVETLRAPTLQSQGHFTNVKFDQIKSPVPFFAITQALNGLFRQLLSEPEARLVVWRRRLQRAVGKEGRVLADVLPSVENVFDRGWLDNQPPVATIGAQESEERFQNLVQKVLRIFARADKPLIVLFDDLQWSTSSDLAFIRSLAMLGLAADQDPLTCKMANPMLLICAWRDNEVSPSHIVETELCAKLPAVDLTLTLEPLTLQAVSSFVSESLRNPSSTSDLAASRAPDDQKISKSIARLSQLILDKTRGSPLFVSQLLKSFNAEGLFTFNFATRQWEFDLGVIASKTVSSDVVELLLVQLRKFSPQCQDALCVAACLGSEELPSAYLAQAAGITVAELARDLSEAVSEGLLEARGAIDAVTGSPSAMSMDERSPSDQGLRTPMRTTRAMSTSGSRPSIVEPPSVPQSYRFFHDRCQQAAYALIPTSSRSTLHYSIGQRLVASTPESSVSDRIFDLVTQLNHGIQIITASEDRFRLAEFNYIAATRAHSSTAFEAARIYLQTAWDLLGSDPWSQQPELMAKVTEAFVDVEYSLTDYAAAQEYIRIYLTHVPDVVAKLRVYARSIRCASAVGDSVRAIQLGREGLAMAGVHLPDDTEGALLVEDSVRKKLNLGVLDIQNLAKSATNKDAVARGCQSCLAALVPPIYFVRIELLGALSSLSLALSIEHGLDDNGAFMLTLHAITVRNKYRQDAESLAYGQTAIEFFNQYGGTPLACPTYKVFSSHVAVWAMPIADTLPTFREALKYGFEYRDAEYAGFGCGEYCIYSLFAGVPLPEIDAEIERYGVYVRKFRHEISTTYIGVIQQFIACMTGKAIDPLEIEGPAFTSTDYQLCRDKGYVLSVHMIHMLRLVACVFFGDFEKAQLSVDIGRKHIAGASGLLYPILFRVFEAVVLLQRYDTLSPDEHTTLEETTRDLSQLADAQATTFRPLQLWLKAEAASISQEDRHMALHLFDEAIEHATAGSQLHLVGLLNERAAATVSNPKFAIGYLLEAYTFWTKWGCVPKVHHLEATHPTVSFPTSSTTASRNIASSVSSNDHMHDIESEGPAQIAGGAPPPPLNGHLTEETHSHRSSLPESSLSSHPLPLRRPSTLERSDSRSFGSQGSFDDFDSHDATSGRGTERSDPYGRSHLATELDLRTVITAQNVISGELSVDGVVSKLLNLALRTVGAELCLLVLDKSGTLCAEAIARSDVSSVQHLRRTDSIDLQPERYPTSVINLVARTKEMVVNSLETELTPDPYLARHQPKSILCHALVASHGRVIGILYLENTQTYNAFTSDRLEILSLVSGQAASTIEKARLVNDLSKTNENLQRSQAALEASNRTLETRIAERTASLQAEVKEKERAQAEMRKSKEVAESATAQKSQFLANMSHEIRTPFNAVVALSGLLLETPLTPVQTDYIETIKNSSQELLVVINDILDYSKIELDHLELSREPVQLRSVLESSMDMVAERAASKQVELALLIAEGDIHVFGDITRLRQIIVNLLSNAVKFTQDGEIKVTASSSPASSSPSGEGQVVCRISVQDSGIGIAKENFGKLFRVYSQAEGAHTTATFGGTGLGLAISRKLSQLMDGDITVESEIGKGSTFTLQWIARMITTPGPDPYSPSNCRDLVGRRCLVVDTHETSRTVLTQLLQSFGLEVSAPSDTTQAYELAMKAVEEKAPYDFFIVDAFLPSFGAHTLIRRLRGRGLSAPTIALTRMGSPIYEEIRQLDCSFLIKPIKRNRLHHALRTIFPAAEPPRISSPRPSSPAFPTNLASRNPLTILCAEDNPINVKVLTHLLKRMGYTCDVAEDGQVALDKVQKKRYDLVLMDVNMPNMDGITSTKKIIELMPDRNSRPSIVCLTANAMSEDKARCLASGADSYVSKPILVPDLLRVLEEASARRKASVVGRGSNGALPSLSSTPPFELELPTSRLGRAERKGSSGSAKSVGASEKSSPSGSPLTLSTSYSTGEDPTANGG